MTQFSVVISCVNHNNEQAPTWRLYSHLRRMENNNECFTKMFANIIFQNWRVLCESCSGYRRFKSGNMNTFIMLPSAFCAFTSDFRGSFKHTTKCFLFSHTQFLKHSIPISYSQLLNISLCTDCIMVAYSVQAW